MTSLKLVEGYMPMQMLFELAICVAVFALLSYCSTRVDWGFRDFWQGIGFVAFILLYLKYRIYPAYPVQRACHVWLRHDDRGLHVDVQQRGGLEEIQAAYFECVGWQERGLP